jgi:hypothetical protein
MELNFKFPFPSDFFRAGKTHGSDEEVTHTPIIITDGSASVEFDAGEYPAVAGTEKHASAGLFLESIEARNKHTQDYHVCHTLSPDEVCRVEVTCLQQGGPAKVMKIRGANSATGGSPEIEFEHGTFPRVPVPNNARRKHFNDNFSITRMEIFKVVSGMPDESVHICPLVPNDGKCEITINDPHVI